MHTGAPVRVFSTFSRQRLLSHICRAEHLIEEKSRGGLLVNGERPSAVVELLLGSWRKRWILASGDFRSLRSRFLIFSSNYTHMMHLVR